MADNFGHIAESYDSTFTHTKTGKYQRNRVWKYLAKDLPSSSSKVLELNCGTGEDAVFILQHEHSLVTTDLSEEMVNVTKKKTEKFSNVEVRKLDLNDLDKLESADFKHVFSNFGGLNCLSPDQIRVFAQSLSSKMSSKGKFTAVIMGRKCWWERFYFRVKGDKKSRNRRLSKEAVMANVEGTQVPTWYYSPKEFDDLIGPTFKLTHQKSIGLFIPPSYMDKAFEGKGVLLRMLYFFEKISFGAPFLANRSDHFYLTFEKID